MPKFDDVVRGESRETIKEVIADDDKTEITVVNKRISEADIVDVTAQAESNTNNISTLEETVSNIALVSGKVKSEASQDITNTEADVAFSVDVAVSDTDVMTFDATNDTVTFLKAGRFSTLTNFVFSTDTSATYTITSRWRNKSDNSIISEKTGDILLDRRDTKYITVSNLIDVVEADLPLTVNFIIEATSNGATIDSFNSTISSNVAGDTNAVVSNPLTNESEISDIVSITRADYDSITPINNKLYVFED